VLNGKLARIRELIDLKEKVELELAQLIGEAEKPKRGRPAKKEEPEAVVE
jgi:hypothetical protein